MFYPGPHRKPGQIKFGSRDAEHEKGQWHFVPHFIRTLTPAKPKCGVINPTDRIYGPPPTHPPVCVEGVGGWAGYWRMQCINISLRMVGNPSGEGKAARGRERGAVNDPVASVPVIPFGVFHWKRVCCDARGWVITCSDPRAHRLLI